MALNIKSFKELLEGVPATGAAIDLTKVTQMRTWDDLQRDITAANNNLVAAEAEEHRAAEAHAAAIKQVENCKAALAAARQVWIDRSRVLLAITTITEEPEDAKEE